MASTLIVGCGFLGRRVGRLLNARGETVYGTSRSEAGGEAIRAWGIEPVLADVTRPETLDSLPTVDRMLYCVGFDRTAGIPMRTVYVDGLKAVIERTRGRVGKVIYASSTGVYGRDADWVDEDSPAEPRHESGKVCLEAEEFLRHEEKEHGLTVVILRYAGLYGPDRVIRRAAIEKGEPIVGQPEKYLNVIHIDDAASAAVAALDQAPGGSMYVVSDDRPVQRTEYYGTIAEYLGVAPPTFRPPVPGSPEAAREEANKRVRNRRMKEELGVALTYPDITTGLPAALGGRDA